MAFSNYDNWLAYDRNAERGAALESLIDGDEVLSDLQRRADTAQARADKLKAAHEECKERFFKLANVARRAQHHADRIANQMQAVIEDVADRGYGDEPIREDE